MKFADDLTLSIPVKSGASNSNSAANEVQCIVEWTSVNRMQLNFKKTWEILLKGKSTKALPVPLAFIERKPSLKLLGLTFQSNLCNCNQGQNPGGGGYCHIWAIWVCAAVKGMVSSSLL